MGDASEGKPFLRWAYSRWMDRPEKPREFVRETERYLFRADGKRYAKHSSYSVWFSSEQEVIDRINACKAAQESERAENRKRNAAEEMFNALGALRKAIGKMPAQMTVVGWTDVVSAISAADAALASARGETKQPLPLGAAGEE